LARESDKPAKDRSRGHAARRQLSLDEALRKLGEAIVNEPVPETLYRALGVVDTRQQPAQDAENEPRTVPAMDQNSFRDMLAFSIGFVVESNRPLLRQILKKHVSDDARQQLANRVLEHLELAGFEIDEAERVMRKRDRGYGW
jgi:hypothetical protein